MRGMARVRSVASTCRIWGSRSARLRSGLISRELSISGYQTEYSTAMIVANSDVAASRSAISMPHHNPNRSFSCSYEDF
jgi:hypothetical protein